MLGNLRHVLVCVVFGQVLRFLREYLLSGAKSDPKTNRRLYIPFQTTKAHVRWIIFDVLSRWTSCLVSLAVYGQVLKFLITFLPIGATKQHQNTFWDIDPSWQPKYLRAWSFWCTFKDWTSHNVYTQVLGSYYEFYVHFPKQLLGIIGLPKMKITSEIVLF